MRICFFLIAILIAPMVSHAGDIVVNVTNIKNNNGQVILCLFDKTGTFPDCRENTQLQEKYKPINNQKTSAVFKNVPDGVYAVSILHDENANNKFDTNWLGLPKEGLGASNLKKLGWGAPEFEDGKFQHRGETTLIIPMLYF